MTLERTATRTRRSNISEICNLRLFVKIVPPLYLLFALKHPVPNTLWNDVVFSREWALTSNQLRSSLLYCTICIVIYHIYYRHHHFFLTLMMMYCISTVLIQNSWIFTEISNTIVAVLSFWKQLCWSNQTKTLPKTLQSRRQIHEQLN